MPEGTIHEDDQLVFFQTDVRLAGKGFLGDFVPDTCLPEGFFEEEFRFGALGADPGHVVGPLGSGIEAVFLAELGDGYFGEYVGFILLQRRF